MSNYVSMYLRTIKRKNKDGSVVEYVQLAHNVRHPEKGYPKAEVIHSFGRRDQLDLDGLKRLVTSIGRFIELDDHEAAPDAESGAAAIQFTGSRSVGCICLLHGLWDRLQIGACIGTAGGPQSLSAAGEHALLAMVAGRALAPLSAGMTIGQLLPPGIGSSCDAYPTRAHFDPVIETLCHRSEAVREAVCRMAVDRLNLNTDVVFVRLVSAAIISPVTHTSIPIRDHSGGPEESTVGMAVSQTGMPIEFWPVTGAADSIADVGTLRFPGLRLIGEEANSGGRHLVFSRGAGLPADVIARGHERLMEIEQVWRILNQPASLPQWAVLPAARADAGMLLAWIALLLMRVAEAESGMSWRRLCLEMQTLHLGEFDAGGRRIRRYTALTANQEAILRKLGIDLPLLPEK